MIVQHAIETLEFAKIITAIRGKCVTPYGSDEVDRIAPLFDVQQIDQKLSEISQMMDIIRFGSAFPLYRLEDSRSLIDRALVEGAFLEPKAILQICELVEVSISINGYEKEERPKFPAVAAYLPQIRAFPELVKEIRRSIDERGDVKDSASKNLRRIRVELHDSRRKIIAKLEGLLAGQRKQAGWQDDVITQRNGRYVIPVLAGSFSQAQGILHDRSQSGATFYIEPNETVELNNKINQLGQDERLELDRILRAITAEIAQRAEALLENCRLIGILDKIHAAACIAIQIEATRPQLTTEPKLGLVDARHPLLILQHNSVKKVVPLTLSIDDSRRVILVTGPNTGGKTIALKTIGLMVLMAQSGLPLPASEKTEMGIFQQVFADIGDEQSIELSLSTFSSHIKNIISAIGKVSPDSLVLFDEIGAGTDPKEGAALAEAIVLFLVEKGARLVATTHYSHLKTLALDIPEIENASLEFDRKSLTPTYRMQLGIPGSSYAVEIASRLGMAPQICEHASTLLGSSERTLTDLIASLETELATLRTDKARLSDRLTAARELEEFYRTQTDKLKAEVNDRKKEALAETEQLLEKARKETERIVAEIRKTQADDKSVKQAHQFLKATEDELTSQQRESARESSRLLDQSSFAKGDHVRILSLGQEGQIDELVSGEKARVQVGNVTTVVPLRDLEKLAGDVTLKAGLTAARYDTQTPASPEIHLRGMTVDEATDALDKFLDNAVVSGLTQVYVIHGKGTGTLRRTLTEWLKSHSEVVGLRLGNWNEGGAGVTVVKLKE